MHLTLWEYLEVKHSPAPCHGAVQMHSPQSGSQHMQILVVPVKNIDGQQEKQMIAIET